MTEWRAEQDRVLWWELCQQIRQRHETCLGENPMLLSERDGYVPPQAMLFRTVSERETVSYPIELRAKIMELLVRWARERQGVAIGTIFQGVSREEEAGKIHLRPTILSCLLGVGRFEGWVFEINQRIDRNGSHLILRTPLVRRLGPNRSAMDWEAEGGSGEVLRGPWPKTVPILTV